MTHMNKNANYHDHGYTLGEWQVFPETGILAKGDHHTHAEPKVMQVLESLIKAQGKMVSRDELINRVWPRVVVNDEVLTRAISELRTLLGDVSRERRYIITVPKRGYRLLMPAIPLADLPNDRLCPSEINAPEHDPVPAEKPESLQAAFEGIRQLLSRPATAYFAVPLLALLLWMGATNMGNDSSAGTNFDIAHDTVLQLPNPRLSATLQSEMAQLHVAGSLPESDEHVPGFVVPSVLMMPLAVITDDELTRTFAAGLTEDLRHAVFEQANLQIVEQLDVQSLQNALIFSGSVRIYDQSARINLQLVDAEGSTLLWSGSFECVLEAQLQLQANIAAQAGKKLKHSFNTFI